MTLGARAKLGVLITSVAVCAAHTHRTCVGRKRGFGGCAD